MIRCESCGILEVETMSDSRNKIELVDAATLAERFSVTVATVNAWVREGRIPYIRASRKVIRFIMTDVEAALTHKHLEDK